MYISPSSMQSRLGNGGIYRGGGDNIGDYRTTYNTTRIGARSPSVDNSFTSSRTLPRRFGTTSSSVRPLPVGPLDFGHGLDDSISTSSSSSVRSIPIRYSSDSTSSTLGRRSSAGSTSAVAPGKPPLPSSAYDRIQSTLGSRNLSSYSPNLRHQNVGIGRYARSSSTDRSSQSTPQRNYTTDSQHRSLPANTSHLIQKFERLSTDPISRPGSTVGSRRPSLSNYENIVLGSRSASPHQGNYMNGTSTMRNVPIYHSRTNENEERDGLASLMTSPSVSSGVGTVGAGTGSLAQTGLYRSRGSAISVPDVPRYASNYKESMNMDNDTSPINSHYGGDHNTRSLERHELEDDDDEDEETALRRKYSPATYGRSSDERYTTGKASNNVLSNSSFLKNDLKRNSVSSVDSSESSRLSSGRSSNISDGGGNSRSGDSLRYICNDDNNDVKKSGLVGLRNLGNTCFMNSVLQCLSNTRPLREYCLHSSSSLTTDINNNTTSRMKGALVKAFRELLLELWSMAKGGYISPDRFKTQIQKFAPRFTGYSQQDAQEFLRYLLQGLHEDINRVKSRPPLLAPIDDTLPDAQKSLESWKRYLRVDDSKIVDIFVGQLKSELKCTHCGHVSTTFDPFWDLSLPIPQDKRGQVELYDCLDTFTREEVLDGDEKPICDECKTRRRCTKRFTIQKYPSILVLHLKRFSGERYRARLSTPVDFPLVKLDLSDYASAKSAVPPTYDLYAVSNHSGTPLTGHYTAYCKIANNNRWYLFDDTRVTPVNERSVVSSEAYVLFYELTPNGSCSRL